MVKGIEKNDLAKVGKDLGVKPEPDKPGPGRRTGSLGAMPKIRTMPKKDLMSEVGTSRKRIRELEDKISELVKKPPEIVEISPELWGVFPAMGYNYLATMFGPHWRLKEDEVKLYGQAIERVANKYMGQLAGDNPEIFALVLVTISTALPRVVMTFVLRRKAKDEKGPTDDKIPAE